MWQRGRGSGRGSGDPKARLSRGDSGGRPGATGLRAQASRHSGASETAWGAWDSAGSGDSVWGDDGLSCSPADWAADWGGGVCAGRESPGDGGTPWDGGAARSPTSQCNDMGGGGHADRAGGGGGGGGGGRGGGVAGCSGLGEGGRDVTARVGALATASVGKQSRRDRGGAGPRGGGTAGGLARDGAAPEKGHSTRGRSDVWQSKGRDAADMQAGGELAHGGGRRNEDATLPTRPAVGEHDGSVGWKVVAVVDGALHRLIVDPYGAHSALGEAIEVATGVPLPPGYWIYQGRRIHHVGTLCQQGVPEGAQLVYEEYVRPPPLAKGGPGGQGSYGYGARGRGRY